MYWLAIALLGLAMLRLEAGAWGYSARSGPGRGQEGRGEAHAPLRGRFRAERRLRDGREADVLLVEIRGSVYSAKGGQDTDVMIWLSDISNGPDHPQRIVSAGAGVEGNGRDLCYQKPNGVLPAGWSVLAEWATIEELDLGMVQFARKGPRSLAFSVSIVGCETGEVLATTRSTFVYHNGAAGYLDLQENRRRIVDLAGRLAEAVAQCDQQGAKVKNTVIENWRERQGLGEGDGQGAGGDWYGLGGLLESLRRKFRHPQAGSLEKKCGQLVEIAPLPDRYAIVEFCVHVAMADGRATGQELALLRNLADWLKIDAGRFQAYLERMLSATNSEVEDLELLLGITTEMTPENLRQQLSRAYRKWNARVTHNNGEIRHQAERMLELIAQARSQC